MSTLRQVLIVVALAALIAGCSAPGPMGAPGSTRPPSTPVQTATPSWSPASASPGGPAATFPPTPVPSTDRALYAVTFADVTTGWVAGDGVIWATVDGGAAWHRVWSGGENVVELVALDRSHAWALAAPHTLELAPDTLLRSDDGGASWSSFRLIRPLANLVVTGPTEAWALVDVSGSWGPTALLHTTDGGRSWSTPRAMASAQAICGTQDGIQWAASGGVVWLSADGGHSWQRHDTGLPSLTRSWQESLGCADDAVWLAAAGGSAASQEAYVVTRSLDRGRSWQPIYGSNYFPAVPPGVTRIDDWLGPFVIVSGRVARFLGFCPACAPLNVVSLTSTDDGGRSSGRANVSGIDLEWALDLAFPDMAHGWIAASHPTPLLLRTTDGGRSWQRVVLP